MDSMLVVVKPFGAHSIGDVIADAGKAKELLASENAHDVVRISHNQETLPLVQSDPKSDNSIRDGEI